MERYLEAADTALNLAIANRPQPPPMFNKRISIKEGHPIRGGEPRRKSIVSWTTAKVVCFCSSAWHNVSVSPFYPSDGGYYRFRISASGFQSSGKPVTFRVTA